MQKAATLCSDHGCNNFAKHARGKCKYHCRRERVVFAGAAWGLCVCQGYSAGITPLIDVGRGRPPRPITGTPVRTHRTRIRKRVASEITLRTLSPQLADEASRTEAERVNALVQQQARSMGNELTPSPRLFRDRGIDPRTPHLGFCVTCNGFTSDYEL